jgi:hypothetical protein
LQIERPSKDAHEAAIVAIDAEIEAIKSTRNGVQAKIDAALGNKRDLNKLKNRKVSYQPLPFAACNSNTTVFC